MRSYEEAGRILAPSDHALLAEAVAEARTRA